MVVSLFGFAYTVYPVINIFLFPPQPVQSKEMVKERGFYVSIPKIHAYSQVIENVDPWTESVYQEALKKGVAHAKGTSLPGGKGTMFLFAHSSGNPWEVTHTNTIFLRLGELEHGDEIVITYKNKIHTFTVVDKKEVWPHETHYLEETQKDQLILQTCTPIGTSLKRLLIFAKE